VPAGPLLSSSWVTLAAKLGFDVPTYKTIRSAECGGHGMPNILYIDPEEIYSGKSIISTIDNPDKDIDRVAITNSFGMGCRDRQFLQEDIPRANASLQEGQVMVVSVVGTPLVSQCDAQEKRTAFIKDFVDTAQFAKDCGAKIIEANFSCPNVCSGEGSIFLSPESVYEIASAMTAALQDTPLLIKVGAYHDMIGAESAKNLMKQVLEAAVRAKVSGVCGINTLSRKVITRDELPALGAERLTSGICGGPIRKDALRWVQMAREILDANNSELGSKLVLAACGGITKAEHFVEFWNSGAAIAMSATGMMWDPYLAYRYHNRAVSELA